MKKLNKSSDGFTFVEVLLVLATLAVIGVAGYFVAKHVDTKKASTTTSNPSSSASSSNLPAVSTDTWTGAGSNNNWSTSANWSNGVPQSNNALIFDYGNSDINSNNDLKNLTINGITFEGGPSSSIAPLNINLTGNSVNLSDGITDRTGGGVASNLKFSVGILANQNFNIGNGGLNLTTVNLGNNNLTISGSNSSSASLNSLSGGGELKSGIGSLVINKPSQQYSGKTTISSGALLVDNPNSLGGGSIVISNGTSLIVSTNSTTVTISNPITMSGNGYGAGTTQYDGNIGAIETLNTANGSTNVTLSGQVTLTANTQLGFTNDQTVNPGKETYLLTETITNNGYTLTGLTNNVTISKH